MAPHFLHRFKTLFYPIFRLSGWYAFDTSLESVASLGCFVRSNDEINLYSRTKFGRKLNVFNMHSVTANIVLIFPLVYIELDFSQCQVLLGEFKIHICISTYLYYEADMVEIRIDIVTLSCHPGWEGKPRLHNSIVTMGSGWIVSVLAWTSTVTDAQNEVKWNFKCDYFSRLSYI